jgi:hypothetical protein
MVAAITHPFHFEMRVPSQFLRLFDPKFSELLIMRYQHSLQYKVKSIVATVIIQALNLQGKIIEGARWEVDPPPGLQEGQSMAILIRCADKDLENYLTKARGSECYLERDQGKTFVSLSFIVKRIRHMIAPSKRQTDTLCHVVPTNGNVEQILIYLFTPSKISEAFMRAIRSANQ